MEMSCLENRSQFVMRLFEAYYNRVFAFVRRSAPLDVTEDVAQEVFVRLLQHPRLEKLDLSVSYLIKIAHNLLRRRHARSSRLRELLDTAVKDDLVQRHGRTDRRPPREEMPSMDASHLGMAMRELTLDECEAIRLIIHDGKSYIHAAEALNVTVTTINNWKHRGLVKLRKYAQQQDAVERTSHIEAAATG